MWGIIKKKYREDKILKIEWLLCAIIAISMLFLFCYEDLRTLTVWSMNLSDVLFTGRIYEFYLYCSQNVYGLTVQYVGGNFVGLIPWAVWNMPMWLLEKTGIVSRGESVIVFLWSHLFLVLCLIGCIIIFRKIFDILNITENKSIVTYLFAASPFICIAVYYSGQTEILTIFFFLLSLYSLFRKDKLFFLWTCIAVTIKPFYLISYIAIILLKEKNIFKIFGKILLTVSGIIVFELLFYMAPLYRESMAQGPAGGIVGGTLQAVVPGIFGIDASLVIIGMAIIYFMAYVNKNENSAKEIIYFALAPLLVFFMFSEFEHYRIAIMVPLVYLLIAVNTPYFRYNMILTTVMNLSGLAGICYGSNHIFNTRYMETTVISLLFENGSELNGRSISQVLHSIPGMEMLITFVSACFLAGTIIFLFINYPRKEVMISLVEKKCERWIIWCNSFILFPILLIMVVLFYR